MIIILDLYFFWLLITNRATIKKETFILSNENNVNSLK